MHPALQAMKGSWRLSRLPLYQMNTAHPDEAKEALLHWQLRPGQNDALASSSRWMDLACGFGHGPRLVKLIR